MSRNGDGTLQQRRDPKNGTLKQRRDPKPPSFYRSAPLLYPVYHAINTNTFSFENA